VVDVDERAASELGEGGGSELREGERRVRASQGTTEPDGQAASQPARSSPSKQPGGSLCWLAPTLSTARANPTAYSQPATPTTPASQEPVYLPASNQPAS